MSGNVDKFGNDIVSWVHPGRSQIATCIDFIAIPRAWSLGFAVVGDPGLRDVQGGHDHFPVAVDLRAALQGEGLALNKIDVEELHTPEGCAKADRILAAAPPVPWHVDVDSHIATINAYIAESFSHAFPKHRKPRCPAFADATWSLISQRRGVRRMMARARVLESRQLLHAAFGRVAKNTCPPTSPFSRREGGAWDVAVLDRFQKRKANLLLSGAKMAQQLRLLTKDLKRSVKQDEADFMRRMFEQARHEGPHQLHSLLRAVLKTGRRYKAHQFSPCLRVEDRVIEDPTQVRLELGRHFARAERAEEVPFAQVQFSALTRESLVKHDSVDVAGVPTMAKLVSAFAAMKGRKAPGIAGLPPDIFKASPMISSYLHMPIYLKILARGRVPLLWRGALIATVPKAGKPQHQLSGHRSIALQEPACKAWLRATRGALERALNPAATPGMAGGRKGITHVEHPCNDCASPSCKASKDSHFGGSALP